MQVNKEPVKWPLWRQSLKAIDGAHAVTQQQARGSDCLPWRYFVTEHCSTGKKWLFMTTSNFVWWKAIYFTHFIEMLHGEHPTLPITSLFQSSFSPYSLATLREHPDSQRYGMRFYTTKTKGNLEREEGERWRNNSQKSPTNMRNGTKLRKGSNISLSRCSSAAGPVKCGQDTEQRWEHWAASASPAPGADNEPAFTKRKLNVTSSVTSYRVLSLWAITNVPWLKTRSIPPSFVLRNTA